MYILSFYSGHDSSVCLMKDGKILVHLEIERLTRVKRHHGNLLNDPKENIGKPWEKEGIMYFVNQVFNEYKITWDDISYVAVMPDFNDKDLVPKGQEIVFVNHHEAHAASSYFMSPYNESLIFTVDGGGNDGGGLFGYGKDNKIEVFEKLKKGSLGTLWTESRKLWSDSPHGPIGTEGVLMGAAPLGKNIDNLHEYLYQQVMDQKMIYASLLNEVLFSDEKSELDLVKDDYKMENEQDYFDYCRTLQEVTDRIFLEYFNKLLMLGKSKNVCLAGGTSLNCIAISKVLEKHQDLNLYFCPAVNDGGLVMGACLWVYYQTLGNEREVEKKYHTPYLGFERSGYNYEELLKNNDLIEYSKSNNVSDIAELVSQGNIVSVYHGRSESGRRALGNRSLVCDSRKKGMKKKINEKVKHRHWYRPFAPSVLEEKASEVFDYYRESPYMSIALPVKKEWQERVPAVTHIDGTSRLQTVSKDLNPFYYDLIQSFYKKTGVPLVLNTSFNDNEPIVETPEDALKCFLGTDIDYLYIEGFLVKKKK